VRRVPFSCFARSDSFSAVAWASGPVFMFCAPRLVFSGTEGVVSLLSCFALPDSFSEELSVSVPFSYFARLDSFSTVPSASGPDVMFYEPGLVYGGVECVGCRFHVLHARNHFRRYRGRRVPFSCFALPHSFSTIPRASGPVLMFYAPRIIFDGAEGVGSHFHVSRSRSSFRRYRGR
jgi:hypothetical protein